MRNKFSTNNFSNPWEAFLLLLISLSDLSKKSSQQGYRVGLWKKCCIPNGWNLKKVLCSKRLDTEIFFGYQMVGPWCRVQKWPIPSWIGSMWCLIILLLFVWYSKFSHEYSGFVKKKSSPGVGEGISYNFKQCEFKTKCKWCLKQHIIYFCIVLLWYMWIYFKKKPSLKQHIAVKHEGLIYKWDQCDYKANKPPITY